MKECVDEVSSLPLPNAARLTELWLTRDYEGILSETFPFLSWATVDGQPISEMAQKLSHECPPDIRARHPDAMLRLTYLLYCSGKQQEADALMQLIRADIESIPDQGERRMLLGEWAFVSIYPQYPHIDRMLSALEQANELTDGRVRVLNADEPFLFMLSSPYAVFHMIEGKAEEQGELFERFVALYEKLTDGGGLGGSELYWAGLCYYRGDFAQSKLLCYKAAYLAESKRQTAVQMGAAKILAQISMFHMDMDAFSEAVDMLERTVAARVEYGSLVARSLEHERSDLYFEASVTKYTPEWIQKGTLEGYPGRLWPFLKYAQFRYFFYSQMYEACIGLGEALLRQWSDCGVLVKATIGMYVAVSYMRLGHRKQGMELFKRSFPPLFKDKLYLVFTHFYVHWDGILDDYLKTEYPNDADEIFRLVERNRHGRMRFMRTYLESENSLTAKEREVAELAALGLQNKEIALQMRLSVNTVRTHLRSVFEKLDINRRSEIDRRLKK